MQQHDPKTCPDCNADLNSIPGGPLLAALLGLPPLNTLRRMEDTIRNAKMPDNSTPPRDEDDCLQRGIASIRAIAANMVNTIRAQKRGEPGIPASYTSQDAATLFCFLELLERRHGKPAAAVPAAAPDDAAPPPANPEAKDEDAGARDAMGSILPLVLAALLSGKAKVEVIDLGALNSGAKDGAVDAAMGGNTDAAAG